MYMCGFTVHTHMICSKEMTLKVKWLYMKQALTMQIWYSVDLCVVNDAIG